MALTRLNTKIFLVNIVIITALILICSSTGLSQTVSFKLFSEEIIQDTARQHFWQVKRSKILKNTEEVNAYLATLNQAEYNDWRLPTEQELFQLFSTFDLKLNGNIKIRLEGNYWLLSNINQPYVGTWEIGDQCGPSRTFYKGQSGYVRAIRP